MIYVEHERATSLTDAAWWARCDDCQWTSGPHPGHDTEADPGKRAAEQAADEHALEMGEVTYEELREQRRGTMTSPDLATDRERLDAIKAHMERYRQTRAEITRQHNLGHWPDEVLIADLHIEEFYEEQVPWLIEQAEELARLRDEQTHATIDDLPTTLETP